jgi:hypothetical protein
MTVVYPSSPDMVKGSGYESELR